MDHDKKIISYLDGEMQGEELRLFRLEIEKDAGLAGLVEEIRNLQDLARKAILSEKDPETELDEDIRREIRDMVYEFRESHGDEQSTGDFNSKVQDAAGDYFTKPQGKLRTLQLAWYSIAAVIIVGGLLSVVLLKPFSKITPAEVYADYAGIYNKTERITELTRSDDDFLFAVEVFESRDYERSAVLFQMLADSMLTRDYAILYQGHSYMGLNLTGMAINAYEQLLQTAEGPLLNDARWYLSLCYLKKEMSGKAILLLEEISASESPYKAESKRILRSLR